MDIKELYEKLYGDLDDAVRRLFNEATVARFALNLPSDPTMDNLRAAVAAGDIESSFRSVHTLKGLAGSLGFSRLYHAAWDLTEQLRPRLEQADPQLLEAVEKEYARTMELLAKFAESNS